MTDSPKLGLLAAYRKLIQPLVRILVRNDVNFYDFVEVLKSVFVEVADKEEFRLPNRAMSDSRIAILTGLNRKEVARQRDALYSWRAHQVERKFEQPHASARWLAL